MARDKSSCNTHLTMKEVRLVQEMMQKTFIAYEDELEGNETYTRLLDRLTNAVRNQKELGYCK
jgi:hypothetical protein